MPYDEPTVSQISLQRDLISLSSNSSKSRRFDSVLTKSPSPDFSVTSRRLSWLTRRIVISSFVKST